MTKLEQFFFDNAGCSYDPKTETKQEGQARGAAELAKAMHYALDKGWTFEWDHDAGESCNCGEKNCGHTVEYCLLEDASNGNRILGSLSGICGATADYRRVVEAELALEAMHRAEGK